MHFTVELICHKAPGAWLSQTDPVTNNTEPISGAFTNYSQTQNKKKTDITLPPRLTFLSGRTTQQAVKLIYQVLACHTRNFSPLRATVHQAL
jgi:hypothetical protein